MFGIDIPHEYEEGEVQREVLLYPKGRIIEHEDVGLVIAKDLRTAEQISKFDHGLHSRCLGLHKFYCTACLKAGLMKTNPDPHKDNRELLDDVKQATFSEFTDFKFEHKVSIPEFDTLIHEEPQEIQTDSTSLNGILRKGDGRPRAGFSKRFTFVSYAHFLSQILIFSQSSWPIYKELKKMNLMGRERETT